MTFTADWPRARVVFGPGMIARLGPELDALGLARVLVVTTPGRAGTLAGVEERVAGRLAGVCSRAVMHVPIESVRAAGEDVDRVAPDALLAVGGGSAIGLAKALARERTLPIVAVPTTYAGSEMTAVWGITEGALKRTGRDAAVAPRLVVYDPELTLDLPPNVSAASGMNAMAHAVEAMYAREASPVATAAADEAIRALAHALPAITRAPRDLDARTRALAGAHLAGLALQLSAMGLHHRICHVLGGTFGLPHAETHAAVLPHVAAFNAPAAAEAMRRVAAALGATNASAGLAALDATLGLTSSLSVLGLRAADIDRAAALVVATPCENPRPVGEPDVRELLQAAL